MVDFSIFQNNENLLFIFIVFLIGVVLSAILVFIIISVFKLIKNLIKKIFQKDDDLKYAENLEIAIPELEESKEERQKIAEKQQQFGKALAGPKIQYTNIKKSKKENELEKSRGQIFDEKEKKDIEEGLGALKRSGKKDGQNENEEVSVFAKIKIPRAKKVMGGDIVGTVKTDAEKLNNLEKPREETDSVKEENKISDKSEIIREAEIKIPQTKVPEEPFQSKQPVSDSKNLSSEISNKFRKTEPRAAGDDSIFGGKSEVSRIELRQKLRRDPNVWMAEKQAGLTLNPIERAKLEKEVFSQAFGGNISKTDLKWGIKKLNQKMLGAKNLAEKGKIRKQIKFFKKIGGVK